MDLKGRLRTVPDFPKPGIEFIDITTLIKDGPAFRQAVEGLAELCRPYQFDLVVGPEARGFLFGAPLAYALGKGFVPIRKPGKLPAATHRAEYQLEYGQDAIEIHQDAVQPGQRVLVVDDLLATGGTVQATLDLLKGLGAEVAAVAFLIELEFLKGRDRLGGHPVLSLIQLS